MNLQVVDVTKPLGSVSRICAAGHRVVFDNDGSYIEHKATGMRTWMKAKNGVYVLECKAVPEGEARQLFAGHGATR